MSKVSEVANEVKTEFTFEMVVENAIKIPGVKVNRNEFLAKIFEDENVNLPIVLEQGPIAAGCNKERLARLANKLILTRTSTSAAASFVAGIPGGLAMAATIPADTLQFFGMTLRLAQELSYLYGADDMWQGDNVDSERVQGQLILYCGVMFGATGASAGVRVISAQMSKQVAKKLPQQALTKTFWYPIVKQVAKFMGVQMTKEVAAKGISKVIPVIGGLVSGGITFASMQPMGKRLAETLEEANFDYSEEEFERDLVEIENIEYTELEEEIDAPISDESDKEYVKEIAKDPQLDNDIFGMIEKLASLKNAGILTEEEFQTKKMELLARL